MKQKRICAVIILFIVLITAISVIGVSCEQNTRTAVKKAPCDSKIEYKLRYRTIYNDLTGKDEWVTVSKTEFDKYENIKNNGG